MTESDRGAGPPDAPSLPRGSQYLAIPLGGLAPAHRERSALLRLWHRYSAAVLTMTGCAAVAAAVALSVTPRPIPAFADASSLHIGGVTLQRQASARVLGYVAYGRDAAVLVSGIGMSARSAGAATIGGLPAVGRCEPASPETATRHEHCTFTLGSTSLTSEDVFDGHTRTWRRAYSDGDVVVFSVDGDATPVPIPLPVGR